MKYFVIALAMISQVAFFSPDASAFKRKKQDPKVKRAVKKALDYLAREQRSQGYWEANSGQYRVAMTALCGTALLAEGSTTNQGKYSKNIRRAVTWLVDQADPRSGLIGYAKDYRYTYGHGFSMLFLAQVYGEEEDKDRRQELKRVLTKTVEFSRNAQTNRGGWGYVSAKEGNQFDEGSTCITQVQGLRACRNAGIAVPKDVIDRAKKYIDDCTIKSGPQAGGVVYSITTRGGARPPITAAALAAMFNSGEYDGKGVKMMLEYCKKFIWPGTGRASYGHWHYAHYYYAQVMYRLGDKEWDKYLNVIGGQIMRKQSASGAWNEGYIGPVYTTAINATILQLDKGFLPIFQR